MVRGVLADAVANVVVFACAPCVSGSLVGVAVSAVVSAIPAPGCVGERDTHVLGCFTSRLRADGDQSLSKIDGLCRAPFGVTVMLARL